MEQTPLVREIAEEEDDEPVADTGEGTPLMKDGFADFEDCPFRFERKADEPSEEKLWTVDEIAKTEEEPNDAHVDAIIDDILRASAERNRE